MTGIDIPEETLETKLLSKPSFVPSLSILVSRISPAPYAATCSVHSKTSIPVLFLPP